MAPFLVAMSLGCLGTTQFCFAISVCCMMLTLFKREEKTKQNSLYCNMELWLIDDFFSLVHLDLDMVWLFSSHFLGANKAL